MNGSIFCACGAQWHGAASVLKAAPIIERHRGQAGPAYSRCRLITHGSFVRHFRCGCDACILERQKAWERKQRR